MTYYLHNTLEKRGLSRTRLFYTASLLAICTISQTAAAQTIPTATLPVYQEIDKNGVDVISGTYYPEGPSITIGDDKSHLKASLSYIGGVLDTRTVPNFNVPIQVGTKNTNITYDGRTDYFLGTLQDVYTSSTSNGSSLVYNQTNGIYTYVSSDETSIVFSGSPPAAQSIHYPDGETIKFYYDTRTLTFTSFGGSTSSVTSIISASSNRGYDIHFEWDFSSGDNYEKNGLISIYAINRAIDYCDPTQATCSGLTQPWPKITRTAVGSTTQTLTDQRGGIWRYSFAGTLFLGPVLGLKRPSSSSTDNISITYGTNQKVSSITIGSDTWTYAYVLNTGSPVMPSTTTVTDPQGGETVYYYYVGGYSTAIKNPLNQTTTFGYDANGRQNSVVFPEGNKIQVTYDARGNVTSTTLVPKPSVGGTNIVSTALFVTTCANIMTCNKPTYTRDPNGNQTDYTYDSTTGMVTTVTAPAPMLGGTRPQTRFTYSGLQAYYKNAAGSIVASGVPISELTETSTCQTTSSCAGTADEIKTSYNYGPQSSGVANNLLPVAMTVGSGDGALAATSAFGYDAVGNLTSIDGPLPGTADTTAYRYDAGREQIGVISPDPDGAGPMKRRAIKTTYSADGLVTEVERGTVNGTSDTDWAAFTSLQQTTTTYDASDRPTVTTLTAGGSPYQVTQQSYDTLGRPQCTALRLNSAVWTSLPSSACSLGATGSYGPDRISKTTYDAASQTTKVQTAYGTADQADDVANTFNANGTLATLTDAQGNKTSYTYDGFDRLSQIFYPVITAGAGTSSSTDYEQLTYDASGNVTSRRLRDGSSISYTYDADDRLAYKDLPGSEPDVSYAYDNLGRLTTATDAGSNYVGLAYDALGRAIAQSSPLGVVGMGYDLAGRRTLTVWPDSFHVNYDYDVAGDMTTIRENGAISGIGVLATYVYDDLGRRTSLTRGNGTSTSYGYDNASRLTSLGLNLDGSGTTNDLSLAFSYSPAGQITSSTRSNDGYAWSGAADRNDASSINGLNQTTSVGTGAIGYDSKGNLSGTAVGNYTYSSENLLLSGPSGASLAYDPKLRLYRESGASGTTQFQYDGQNLIGEYDTSGTLQKRYVMGLGIDEPLVEYDKSGGTYIRAWLHADERGSVIAESNDSGTTTTINSYDEYGVPASGNVGRFQYTGQTYLPTLGLYNYKARIYSSRVGRFMQPDPIGYDDGANWYSYSHSDPVNGTDPTGNELCDLNSLGYSKGSGCGSSDSIGILQWITVTAPSVGIFGTTVGLGATNAIFNFGNLGMNFGNSPISNLAQQIQDDTKNSDSISELRKKASKICAPNRTSAACRAAIKAANDAYTADAKAHGTPISESTETISYGWSTYHEFVDIFGCYGFARAAGKGGVGGAALGGIFGGVSSCLAAGKGERYDTNNKPY